MRSIPTSVRRFALALTAVLLAAPLLASSSDLVSANPHAAILPTGTTPPLSVLATINAVDINAYHVSNDNEVTRALGYFDYGKPKILSDDAGGPVGGSPYPWPQAGRHRQSPARVGVMISRPGGQTSAVTRSIEDRPNHRGGAMPWNRRADETSSETP